MGGEICQKNGWNLPPPPPAPLPYTIRDGRVRGVTSWYLGYKCLHAWEWVEVVVKNEDGTPWNWLSCSYKVV